MLISISADARKWYKYNAERTTKLDSTDNKYEIIIGLGDIIGVTVGADGSATVIDMEDYDTDYSVSKRALERLVTKCVVYRGKVKLANAPVRNIKVAKDKNDPEAYTWHKYNAIKGTIVKTISGTKLGTLRKGSVFGLFSVDPVKGGWFKADETLGFDTVKPIKITTKTLDSLIAKASPLKAKPVVTEASPKPANLPIKPKPTTAPAVPDVSKLKELHETFADISKRLKALSKSPIESLQEYDDVKEAMMTIRDRDFKSAKESMREINVPEAMAKIILHLQKENWLSCVRVLTTKKAKLAPPENLLNDEGNLLINKAKLSPNALQKTLLSDLRKKASDVSRANSVDELDAIEEDLNTVFANATTKIQAAMPEKDAKTKEALKVCLGDLSTARQNATDKIAARREFLQEATDDFTPVDDDSEEIVNVAPEATDDDTETTATDADFDSMFDEDEPEAPITKVDLSPVIDSITAKKSLVKFNDSFSLETYIKTLTALETDKKSPTEVLDYVSECSQSATALVSTVKQIEKEFTKTSAGLPGKQSKDQRLDDAYSLFYSSAPAVSPPDAVNNPLSKEFNDALQGYKTQLDGLLTEFQDNKDSLTDITRIHTAFVEFKGLVEDLVNESKASSAKLSGRVDAYADSVIDTAGNICDSIIKSFSIAEEAEEEIPDTEEEEIPVVEQKKKAAPVEEEEDDSDDLFGDDDNHTIDLGDDFDFDTDPSDTDFDFDSVRRESDDD